MICITKLTTLLIQWTPTKFDPEIEAVSFLKCIPYPLNCNPTGPLLKRVPGNVTSPVFVVFFNEPPLFEGLS